MTLMHHIFLGLILLKSKFDHFKVSEFQGIYIFGVGRANDPECLIFEIKMC